MSLIKDDAIVLRRLDYSETSQVIAVFTHDHGQQRLIAKGIKRGTKTRVAVGVDLLELGSVVFSAHPGKEQSLSVMTEWRQSESFPHLRSDLARLYAAQYAAEVCSQLTETGDPHPLLFDAVVQLYRELSTGLPLGSLVPFLLTFLREIGLKPEFDRCVSCGRPMEEFPRDAYFSSQQGGAVCRDCEPAIVEKRRVPVSTMKLLVGERIDRSEDLATAFDVLDYHLRETMSRPARLSTPLRTALGMRAL